MKYLKSGFFIITSSLLSISLVVALTNTTHKELDIVKGNTYSISFDKDNNRLSDYTGSSTRSGDSVCHTLINNDVHIGYTNIKYNADNWLTLTKGAEVYNTSSISGMSNISITVSTSSSGLTLYYGNTVRSDAYSLSINATPNEAYNFDFNGYSPNYFLIKNTNTSSIDITINMMDITFSCSDSHIGEYGESLEISGNSAIYGLYPRRKVISSYLVNEITTKGEVDSHGYYIYNNQYYFKDNDTYFTMDVINWQVMSNNENQYTLISRDVLDAHIFDSDTNVFADSELKSWLNNEFLSIAFALNDESLIGEVDIITQPQVKDNIKLGAYTEYSAYKGVYTIAGNSNTRYWTKTITSSKVYYINYNGSVGNDREVTATDVGVRPLIRVSSLK